MRNPFKPDLQIKLKSTLRISGGLIQRDEEMGFKVYEVSIYFSEINAAAQMCCTNVLRSPQLLILKS